MKDNKCWYPVALFLLINFLLFSGCGGNYGRISKDIEINRSFLNADILPDYNYYYTGPEGLPSAVLRINKKYELVSDLWVLFEPSEKVLKKWVENIRFYNRGGIRYYPYGYKIVYCDGETIGGWYSVWDWTSIECLEDKKVKVAPPPLGNPIHNGNKDAIIKRIMN